MNQAERADLCRKLSRKLADEGRLIEAGFVGLRLLTIPEDAPAIQVEEMRNAFFAGAQHTFASIMQILEPGEEATPKDLQRLALLDIELQEFIATFKKAQGIFEAEN